MVNGKHLAVRGYRILKDEQTGTLYRTAAKQQIRDEGKRVLQTKAFPGAKPWRMNTRVADVRNSLLSPSEMAKCGHDILLRNEDGYAIHRTTGVTHKFDRTSGGWKFDAELESPAEANRIWDAKRLAELQTKNKNEVEADRDAATSAIKEILGMVDETSTDEPTKSRNVSFGDQMIYPFGRQPPKA